MSGPKNPTVNERDARCGCVVRFAFDPADPHLHTPIEWEGRKGCDEHAHDDHREHFRRLRAADMHALNETHPGHGWRHVLENPITGAIRDVKHDA